MFAAKRSRHPRINSKSAVAKRSVNWLPDDLILEVFLRLPRKSVLRFRRVSKGLHRSIDSPVFKKRYDIFHNSVSDFTVMHMEAGWLFSRDFHLSDNLYSSVEKKVSIPHNKDPRFIGSCKGIVCLMVSPAPMDLPALESYVLMNPFNITYQKVKSRNTYNRGNSIGFGYDYATDDYKIVMWETFEHTSSIIQYLHVYSMRRDSWRQIIREFSPAGCSSHVNGICVEGAIHWLWFNKNMNGYSCIAAFDLETDILRSLPLPPQLTMQPCCLRDLGGRLCAIAKCFNGSTIVWVMEEYGVETSWIRLFNIVNEIKFIIGYFPMWDNGRLLFLGSDSKILSWLNTQDGSKEDILILKLPHQQGNNQTWNETQSWVCVRSPLRLRCSESQN